MPARITRRDFVGGILVSTALSGVVKGFSASAQAASAEGFVAPPLRTGLRGSHPGAFEAAHALRDGILQEKNIKETDEVYDLVVVGGGLSGLAAAHFYRKYAGPEKTVLIIENHDDFGGHAKRNEFSVDGHRLVLNGGTLEMEAPERYNQWATMILSDIGVNIDAYKKENLKTSHLYEQMGLRSGLFFNQEIWPHDYLMPKSKVSVAAQWRYISEEALKNAPLSEKARQDLVRIVSPTQPDYMAGHSVPEKKKALATLSYKDYLLTIAKVDPTAVAIFQKTGRYFLRWG